MSLALSLVGVEPLAHGLASEQGHSCVSFKGRPYLLSVMSGTSLINKKRNRKKCDCFCSNRSGKELGHLHSERRVLVSTRDGAFLPSVV